MPSSNLFYALAAYYVRLICCPRFAFIKLLSHFIYRIGPAMLVYYIYDIRLDRIDSGEIIKLILIAPHDSIDRHS